MAAVKKFSNLFQASRDEISVVDHGTNQHAHRTSTTGCGFVVVHYTSWQPPALTTIPANEILKGFTANTQLLLIKLECMPS